MSRYQQSLKILMPTFRIPVFREVPLVGRFEVFKPGLNFSNLPTKETTTLWKSQISQLLRMGEKRGAYRILVGRHEGRRPLGRPRRQWEDNIKMNQDVGWKNGLD
jgi:hypothetical protein